MGTAFSGGMSSKHDVSVGDWSAGVHGGCDDRRVAQSIVLKNGWALTAPAPFAPRRFWWSQMRRSRRSRASVEMRGLEGNRRVCRQLTMRSLVVCRESELNGG